MKRKMITVDGCTACAHVVHAANEMITIYPITPSSPIAEICDAKSATGEMNIWGTVPRVIQMQSEAGVAGAVHGSLTTGALATTISASQGLLLIIPNMYKIAGELIPTVFHVTARSLAAQGLSIFGDHSDVMAARSTGFAMLCSKNVQEAMDFALIAQAATLESRIPFMHFFDGFRTSHEIQKIEELTFDDMRAMIDEDLVLAHRLAGPDAGPAGHARHCPEPRCLFPGQGDGEQVLPAKSRRSCRRPWTNSQSMTGRQYQLFDYFGDPDAERVIVVMGSAGDTILSTVECLNKGRRNSASSRSGSTGPLTPPSFVERSAEDGQGDRRPRPDQGAWRDRRAALSRCRTAIGEARDNGSAKFKADPKIVGGRYGLGSKDFTPAMVKAVFDNLAKKQPKNHFTIGINDDVTDTSLAYDESFQLEGKEFRALFYGLGADGTVGANKNTIKIIGTETDNFAQGYFDYDSKKSGAVTISHLRFGKEEIRNPYLSDEADFIACHNPAFVEKYDMLSRAKEGATFLLTTSHPRRTRSGTPCPSRSRSSLSRRR